MANKSRSKRVHSVLNHKSRRNHNNFKTTPFVNYKSKWDVADEFDFFEIHKRKSSDREKAQELRKLYSVLIKNIRRELHRFWYAKSDFTFTKDVFEITKFSPVILYCFETRDHYYTLENKKGWKLWAKSTEYVSSPYRSSWGVAHAQDRYFSSYARYYMNPTWINKSDELKQIYDMLLKLHDFDVTEKTINTVDDLYC